ncbi:MAG: uroporphyrinogen decarboxylase family protein [Armatimonadota bacterium]
MLTRRDRVIRALDFKPTDRIPKDLGGMASTGISCFAYARLIEALGLPFRRPRVHDTNQMLALPDTDVLDALDCDVATVFWGVTNAFEEPDKWHPYDFAERLKASVRNPEAFHELPDGTIRQDPWNSIMPPSAHVFDTEHAGQTLDFMNGAELPLKDLKQLREDMKAYLPTKESIREIREHCERARNATDRAIFFNGPVNSDIAISAHGGMGVFPVICVLHPDYAAEYHEIMTAHTVSKLEMVLPEISPFVDIILLGGDDWGTQNTTIASPKVFRELFLPYYKQMNDTARRVAPEVKRFIHTCGAIYDVIDYIIESGFDILNPVQWTAGGHSYKEWKDKCRGRIALWGGGVNTQATLPLGTVEDVEREVAEIAAYMAEDSGYVFNGIHNLLAEVEPEKVIAMYQTASKV